MNATLSESGNFVMTDSRSNFLMWHHATLNRKLLFGSHGRLLVDVEKSNLRSHLRIQYSPGALELSAMLTLFRMVSHYEWLLKSDKKSLLPGSR